MKMLKCITVVTSKTRTKTSHTYCMTPRQGHQEIFGTKTEMSTLVSSVLQQRLDQIQTKDVAS